jgi:flagellar hook-length control protein FliK
VTSGIGANAGLARALNGQTSSGAEASADGTDDFAAMLDVIAGPTAPPAAPASNAPAAGEILAGLNLDADADSTDEEAQETADALAAAINALLPFNTTPPSGEGEAAMKDLLSSLADLKAKLDSGEPLTAEFLGKLNGQLDALGDALGIDLSKVPGLEQLSALATAAVPEDADLAAKLAASLVPLAQDLLQDTAPDTAALSKTVADKLAALLQTINTDEATAGKIAELGLAADAQLQADGEAALAKLLAAPATPEAPAAAAVLAAPKLQLEEPVLTGKPAEGGTTNVDASAGRSTEIAAADAANGEQTGKEASDNKGGDGKPADAKPAAIAINANDNKPDGTLPAQPQQQAARVDALGAPRLVQTGYQTSQQQLNLPQIAFELARQTSEGNTRFQIRLDPAELGRIDVQLDIDKSGQVNARLYVEKAETLDLMQRDQRGLEKALHQAGLDSAKTNLEFSLKQNNGGDTGQQGRQQQGRFGSGGQAQGDLPEMPPTINLYRASLSASGVNIIA